jgi:outer membrane protein assembly factor BamB
MGVAGKRSQRLGQILAPTLLVAIGLGGCGGSSLPSLPKITDLNPFAEKEHPLPGKRIPVMQARDTIGGELATADKPVVLPAPRANEEWTQPGGVPSNAPGHLALGGSVKRAWSADVGSGSSTKGKLTASPLVYGGRVFALDATAKVTAVSASGGSVVWRTSLVPEGEREESGYGGGLAIDNGRLYVATGFGTVVALDPATGKTLWTKNIGVPIRSSPTAVDDKVFVVTTEGHVFALAGFDGGELWTFRGLPERTSIISNPSPAVDAGVVIVPYPSGELVALHEQDGTPVWSESLARTRTVSSLASLSDAARPVIADGVVYGVGHAGRLIATRIKTGERLWSLNVPGTQPPVIAGNNIFVVDTNGQLHALTRQDGKVIWSAKLPGTSTWSGPTLAGNQLWLTSNKGQLVGVDPATGRVTVQQGVGGPVYIAPIVAGGRMYVLTDEARLVAYN